MTYFSRVSLMACTLTLGLLAGCAVDSKNSGWHGAGKTYQSEVKRLPDGNFFVEVEAAPLAGRQSGAQQVATDLANNHCALRQQKMTVVKQEAGSHLLINGVSRLTFKCQ
jgi:predicted outer membrane protein